ncbi:MAG: hypothetical protein J6W63_12035 [Treponema sp.]|nr:hypothetical protein [Treponema sp.]
MLEVKNIEVFGLNRALNAINNSFNVGAIDTTEAVTEKREKVALALGKNMEAHQSHDAFLKGILVTFDMKHHGVVMPEFQRYHFADIVMSQSTVHSLEKFISGDLDPYTKYVTQQSKDQVKKLYNAWIESGKSYESYMALRHNLPQGFEMWATVTTNYLQLKTICIQRKAHRNREDWTNFISACYSMPRFRELTGLSGKEWDIVS